MSYEKSKRILDILIATILIFLLSPVYLLVSLLIWITDRQEVFVKEPLRYGFKGELFKMYKFRTMIPNAHSAINTSPLYEKWLKHDGKLKLSEDPRLTWIGRIIRKLDIDEMPQFLNVLKGNMSLVGPRPAYEAEIARYLGKYPHGKKYIKRIWNVKPGVTGIWQVSGRNNIKFKDRIILEAKYASHINFKDDLKIFLKTPWVVLTRKGVYE